MVEIITQSHIKMIVRVGCGFQFLKRVSWKVRKTCRMCGAHLIPSTNMKGGGAFKAVQGVIPVLCYNYDTTTTRLAVSVWGLMFVFYFILILSILIVSIKYNVER